jgi:hypothetical protein
MNHTAVGKTSRKTNNVANIFLIKDLKPVINKGGIGSADNQGGAVRQQQQNHQGPGEQWDGVFSTHQKS